MPNRLNPAIRWAAATAAALLIPVAAGAQAGAADAVLGVDTTSFDRSVRPQDDFYAFVNGSWLENTEIPEDRGSYGSFTELAERSEKALRDIIEGAAAEPGAHPAGSELRKVGDLYRSFMDTDRIEALGIAPLEPELARIDTLADDLPALFAELRRAGVQTPIGFFIRQDSKDSDRYITYLSQSGLGLPDRDFYFRAGEQFERLRSAYETYVADLLELAGHEAPSDAARRIMALETRLAESHWSRARSRDRNATYNKFSVFGLEQLSDSFDWPAFMEAAGAGAAREVIIRQPDYFLALDEVFATTPATTWRDYATFKLLDQAAPFLSSDFVEAGFGFRGRILSGLEQNRPRWKRGVSVVQGALGDALGKVYVERHFQEEARQRMAALVDNLLEAFRLGIDRLEWMSPETREQAHAKLATFNTKIGFPASWEDYGDLEIRADDLVGNLRRAAEWQYRRMIERLGQPVDRDEWFMDPYTVNAYYNASNNEIVFPAAILQPPFFNVEADDAVNYGAIGAVIGHEISHGFDDQGRKSDGEGNLRDWWTEADAEAFEARAQRLVEQYNAYNPVDDLHVNGELTLGENIGDLSGLAVAYEAYKLSLDGREPPVIAGFTGDQRFFLGWAQIWRRKSRPEVLRQRLLSNPHSPGRYRVIGVLSNIAAFYNAFDVGPDDEMYLSPDDRVEIW